MLESTKEKKILLVDDETDILNLMEEVLKQDGFIQIMKATNGQMAIDCCKASQPDVIVLDVMLPDLDGIEVCRLMRTFTLAPILFLSSKGDDIDKILGLSSGGDDYVTKPFSPRELVYRIKAQLRRQQYSNHGSASMQPLLFGSLKIDTDACCAYNEGQPLELTAREYKLLLYFIENANKIISKERLYEQVWGEVSAVCDNTIMVHIRHLREKIEKDPSNPKLLITVKGLGYKLIEDRTL